MAVSPAQQKDQEIITEWWGWKCLILPPHKSEFAPQCSTLIFQIKNLGIEEFLLRKRKKTGEGESKTKSINSVSHWLRYFYPTWDLISTSFWRWGESFLQSEIVTWDYLIQEKRLLFLWSHHPSVRLGDLTWNMSTHHPDKLWQCLQKLRSPKLSEKNKWNSGGQVP